MALCATMVVAQRGGRGGRGGRLTQDTPAAPADDKDCASTKAPTWWDYTDKKNDDDQWTGTAEQKEAASGCKCIEDPLPAGNVCLVDDAHKPNPGWSCACYTKYKMEAGFIPELPDLVGPKYYCEL